MVVELIYERINKPNFAVKHNSNKCEREKRFAQQKTRINKTQPNAANARNEVVIQNIYSTWKIK